MAGDEKHKNRESQEQSVPSLGSGQDQGKLSKSKNGGLVTINQLSRSESFVTSS